MKRIISLLICLITIFTLCACGKKAGLSDGEYEAAIKYYDSAYAQFEKGNYESARKILDEGREKFGDSALFDTLEDDIEKAESDSDKSDIDKSTAEESSSVKETEKATEKKKETTTKKATEAKTEGTTKSAETTVNTTTAAATTTAKSTTAASSNKKDMSELLEVYNSPSKLGSAVVGTYYCPSYSKDSANGVKVYWKAKNKTGKTINYYYLTIYAYNAVGDPAYDEITKSNKHTIRVTGPVAPDKDILLFSNIGYYPDGRKFVVGDVKLEYSDGTSDSGWIGTEITVNDGRY